MSSFAAITKKELTQIEVDDTSAKAELAALIRMNGSISFGNGQLILDVSTENAAIARRIYSLIKRIYKDMVIELLVRKKMRLKKNNVYVVRMAEETKEMLTDLAIMENGYQFNRSISNDVIPNTDSRRAYLRGAFLAGGSVNHPETSSYHLEIYSMYEEHNRALRTLMETFGLTSKSLERKKGYILYIKESEKITEFLNIIGAHQALLYFEDVRIMKDMRNSVNRLVNCETANLNKTVGAALRQVENIQLVQAEVGLENLPEKIREIAILRVQHQDVTLKELGEMVPSGKVSKSGVNHRLRKIDQIAERIQAGKPPIPEKI
ncbi:DNA-binding protein WhiA [Marinococcus halophilus]|uniref:Probable cell division protein WhiA n=1 Tax=Marinococcus halophilus TaxID=1371 RepID=A0A510YAE9_MARHA|nr:DNA-binding protein WhiA [Marinococcus halophilus]OZT78903.1 DNA-binding protein WhiA [Marinococcus halophilus]GEK60123.1 putative sporulation transcription regulator WhiA [Marinococcus halophilus]